MRPACRKRQASKALGVSDRKGEVAWLYVPTPKQVDFHETTRTVRRVLYGGQAGPGKSHALRWGLYTDCLSIPNLNCLLLRRTYQQLEQTHLNEMVREQKVIGAVYTSGDKVMRFPNGSVIRAGHCESTADAQNYLSTEYDRIAFDELVTFDRDMALEIMSRARTSKAAVKAAGDAQVWAGTNPGGRGAMWVRDFFIDHTVDLTEFPRYEPERFGFVEATLDDNPYISSEYRRDLEDLPEMRKRQLLYGDWNAFEGQFFSEWAPTKDGQPFHVQRIEIDPATLMWSASLDWGYNAPFSCGFWAHLPDGKSYRRFEWKAKGVPAEDFKRGFWQRVNELGIPEKAMQYVVADPSTKNKTGAGRGESVMETLLRGHHRLPMRPGDNDRKLGWYRVHEMLRPSPDGNPWLIVDPDCKYLIRTLPAMVQDDHDPDDLDTTKDDHACDDLRYHVMGRPHPTRTVKEHTLIPNSIAWWKKYPTGTPQPTGPLA